jgi:EAL and modified HD-GYP domain-containing signal transduction protein
MSKTYIARQKIVNLNGKTFAYELLFRDSKDEIKEFPSNIKATSQVMLNTLTHMNFDQIMGKGTVAFINVDCEVIRSDILELLDPERFVIEILETTKITEALLRNIAQLKKKGYKIALDDFDCSPEMIAKFQPLLNILISLRSMPSPSMSTI